ncbi:hypothetical protein [Rhizobium sp. SL86]|uniref:hypothetical protein n=1 Tax=Rhizobium sp. SL86 TaxID=2995148 RepID=UPI002273C411|nr:hypothetical protein [Rhizobium sp. SL86]MCY1668448.1 hypothetical protein [Rhizobium sp. SL86]
MTNYITINQLRAVNAHAMSTFQEEPATLQQRHDDLERFKDACISHDAEWEARLYELVLLEREKMWKMIMRDTSPMTTTLKR